MKLLTRYKRATVLTALIVLLASSVAYYFVIKIILVQQIDKDLKVEEEEILEYVKEKKSLPNAAAYKGQEIRFEPVDNSFTKRVLQSALVFNPAENEMEPIRTLTFPVRVNNVLFKAIVIKSQMEAEDLLRIIVIVTAATFLLLLVVVFLINRFLLNKLWQPFYIMLQQLRQFNLRNTDTFQYASTEIEEFQELNSSVFVMTQRIKKEFEVLKQFTDNASHEMQTPIAIINSKLDLLLQSSDEQQAIHLQSIYDATSRLSRLNQTLLLLTKIENDQFSNHEIVDFKLLVQQKLVQFDELLKARNITCSVDLQEAFVSMNIELADILVNNIFSNAIKHNYVGGYIHCTLNSDKLIINNSGSPITFNEVYLFKRFQKGDHSEGTGLGLAVVNQICETSGLKIEYAGSNNEHSFTIHFK